MKPVERDLMILLNESEYSEAELEREAGLINELLARVETPEKEKDVVEIMDFNRGRISRKPAVIIKTLHSKNLRSFCFILHKN